MITNLSFGDNQISTKKLILIDTLFYIIVDIILYYIIIIFYISKYKANIFYNSK